MTAGDTRAITPPSSATGWLNRPGGTVRQDPMDIPTVLVPSRPGLYVRAGVRPDAAARTRSRLSGWRRCQRDVRVSPITWCGVSGHRWGDSEFALSDLAARLAGTNATLSTSLRDIPAAALPELIEAELTS